MPVSLFHHDPLTSRLPNLAFSIVRQSMQAAWSSSLVHCVWEAVRPGLQGTVPVCSMLCPCRPKAFAPSRKQLCVKTGGTNAPHLQSQEPVSPDWDHPVTRHQSCCGHKSTERGDFIRFRIKDNTKTHTKVQKKQAFSGCKWNINAHRYSADKRHSDPV